MLGRTVDDIDRYLGQVRKYATPQPMLMHGSRPRPVSHSIASSITRS